MTDEIATLMGKRFIERRDVKAIQHRDGHYEPVRNGDENVPWKMDDLRAHIDGTKSFGHYLVGKEGTCKLFAFDLDLNKQGYFVRLEGDEMDLDPMDCEPRKAWLEKGHPARPFLTVQLRTMAEALALRVKDLVEIPVAIAYSGSKGMHVYGFCGQVPAADARQMATGVLDSFITDGVPDFRLSRGTNFFEPNSEGVSNIGIEIYPKQDDLAGKDLGNLMRLPLGSNRKSGHPAFFVDLTQPYTRLRAADPVDVLTNGQSW